MAPLTVAREAGTEAGAVHVRRGDVFNVVLIVLLWPFALLLRLLEKFCEVL